jgi:hypothetical protein
MTMPPGLACDVPSTVSAAALDLRPHLVEQPLELGVGFRLDLERDALQLLPGLVGRLSRTEADGDAVRRLDRPESLGCLLTIH